MKTRELVAMLQQGIHPVIQFTSPITEFDDGLEQGMLGVVESVFEKDGFAVFSINCKPYFEHNLPLFTHTFLNRSTGEYNATAVESGFYPKNHVVTVYEGVEPEDNIKNFCLYPEVESALHKQYRAENTAMDYVQWLENKVLERQTLNSAVPQGNELQSYEVIVTKVGTIRIDALSEDDAVEEAKGVPHQAIDWCDETTVLEVHIIDEV